MKKSDKDKVKERPFELKRVMKEKLQRSIDEMIENGILHQVIKKALIYEAKKTIFFTEEQRETVFFLQFKEPVKCCHCGKKRKFHWTMRIPFRVADIPKEGFTLKEGETVFIAGSPVCTEHLLLAADEEHGGE